MVTGVAITAILTAVSSSAGAVATATTPAPTPPPAPGVNLATPANLTYLIQHAPADHMGWELPAVTDPLPPPVSSIPLLPKVNAPNSSAATAQTEVRGMDVSSYQGNVDWATAAANGAKFAYTKATEGTYYTSPYFAQQYNGSYSAGLVRGAYAFAVPSYSSGASQASYFVAHGGGWSPDGKTLPGMLDIENNPYGPECYGLSQSAMVGWLADFINTYHSLTGRWAMIYSNFSWWNACTGNNGDFAQNSPLDIASYNSSPGTLPAGWPFYTVWQYADAGTFPGDQDVFNGTEVNLINLALNI